MSKPKQKPTLYSLCKRGDRLPTSNKRNTTMDFWYVSRRKRKGRRQYTEEQLVRHFRWKE